MMRYSDVCDSIDGRGEFTIVLLFLCAAQVMENGKELGVYRITRDAIVFLTFKVNLRYEWKEIEKISGSSSR